MVGEKTLAKTLKKVIHWGKGLAVFITTEAKLFKWDETTHIWVEAQKDGKEERIVIRKMMEK